MSNLAKKIAELNKKLIEYVDACNKALKESHQFAGPNKYNNQEGIFGAMSLFAKDKIISNIPGTALNHNLTRQKIKIAQSLNSQLLEVSGYAKQLEAMEEKLKNAPLDQGWSSVDSEEDLSEEALESMLEAELPYNTSGVAFALTTYLLEAKQLQEEALQKYKPGSAGNLGAIIENGLTFLRKNYPAGYEDAVKEASQEARITPSFKKS